MNFTRTLLRAHRFLLVVVLCVSSCVLTGCIESSFQLAKESRVPKWITIPPDLTRADVSVTMNYYTKFVGNDVKFILKDREGNTLAKASGKTRGLYPLQLKHPPQGFDHGYPSYEVVTVNGVSDIIEHRRMEPIFYINDDPAVRNEFSAELKKK